MNLERIRNAIHTEFQHKRELKLGFALVALYCAVAGIGGIQADSLGGYVALAGTALSTIVAARI
ncbi:MAG TPA: hypothetical protein VMR59_03775 [Patescibacteria group bacterium]|jgi:hypothetical protein|nr:hypothetical protein [Patescibacteria group bacterium]